MPHSEYVESASIRKNVSVKQYRKQKLKILERDFCIHITAEETARAKTLTTIVQIDQFFNGMLNKYWN